MKKLIKATVVTLALSLTTLYASGSHNDGHGHSHAQKEVSKVDVQKTAKKQLARLIKNNKIDDSWSNTAIKNIQKKKFKHSEEWVVTFNNKQIKDKSKQTLYIFVTKYGEVTGANYTGK
jgi:hypothetical protein